MGDSQSDARTGSDATARADTARLRDEVGRLREQLADRDERLAERAELIRELQDEIRRLKKLPRRPDLKPSGLAASKGGDKDTSASGFPGSGRSKTGSRKGRGPRRRNPHLRRRDVTVVLDDVPEGAVHKGYQDHTVRDMVFHAEEVTYRREVWAFPDGSRHVAPLPPEVVTGREQYGPGVKALVIMLYHQGQSTVGRIAALLNDVGLDIFASNLSTATSRFLSDSQSIRGEAVSERGHRGHRRGAAGGAEGRHVDTVRPPLQHDHRLRPSQPDA